MFVLTKKIISCIQSTSHTIYFSLFFVKMDSFFLKNLPIFDKSFLSCHSDPFYFQSIPAIWQVIFYSYPGTGLFNSPVLSHDFVKLYAKSRWICHFFGWSYPAFFLQILCFLLFFCLLPEIFFCTKKSPSITK